jgi:hypothetical protein
LVAATTAVSDILRKRGKDGDIPELQFNLLLAQAEAAASVLKTSEMTARLKQALALPGKSSAGMETAARSILALDDDVRGEVVNAAGTLATGLTDDMRSLLLKTAAAPERKDREIAVRALLLFAPLEKVGELLDKARKEDRETRTCGSK